MFALQSLSAVAKIGLYFLYSVAVALYGFYFVRHASLGSSRVLRFLPTFIFGPMIGAFLFEPYQAIVLSCTLASFQYILIFRCIAFCFGKGQACLTNNFISFFGLLCIPIDVNFGDNRNYVSYSQSQQSEDKDVSGTVAVKSKAKKADRRPFATHDNKTRHSENVARSEKSQNTAAENHGIRRQTAIAWKPNAKTTLGKCLFRCIFYLVFSIVFGSVYSLYIHDYYGKVIRYFLVTPVIFSANVLSFTIWELLSFLVLGTAPYPSFRLPQELTSLSDLWSNRWNLNVGRKLKESIYDPLLETLIFYRTGKQNEKPTSTERAVGIMGTFICSGLFHELVIYWAIGYSPSEAGKQFIFFLIQGVLVIAEQWLRTRNVILMGWMKVVALCIIVCTTAPLFYEPYFQTGLMGVALKELDSQGYFSMAGKFLGLI